MKLSALVVMLLVSSAVLAGCTSKKDEPTSTPTPPTTPTTSSPSPTTTTVTTTTTAPPSPTQVYKGVIKYGSTNDADKTFTVPSGATKLELKFNVNTTAAGAYSIQGEGTPPSGKPSIAVTDPANAVTKTEFEGTSSGSCINSNNAPCSHQAGITRTIPVTAAGAWKVGVRGTGSNVQADVTITAVFV